MQGYMYSTFSIAAIVIHLIINIDLMKGRGSGLVQVLRYRTFLFTVLAYYVADALWGILAGLGWTNALYAGTIFYFLASVFFVFTWGRFSISYAGLGKWPTRILSWMGSGLLAFNAAMLAANFFSDCFFYFDENGVYRIGPMRYHVFALQIAYTIMVAVFVFAKARAGKETERWRNMMVFVNSVTMVAAIALQVLWPLSPFTSLGCLIGNCFFHVFVVRDEQNDRHTRELEKMLERVLEAEKTRSTFFSIVSHDIRTPLNAILGYSELLQSGTLGAAERSEALKAISASGTTLLQLVNDVLDLSKLDAGKMTLQPSPVLLPQLVDEVLSTFKLGASEKHIELVNKTADVPALMLDGHRFRQILFNLIGNAVKFTPHGSITVAASFDGANLTVSVADTGCGIPPEMLSRVLEPFVQIQDPTHPSVRPVGTGLGLSICRRLVEAMHGKLTVESEPWKGSKFTAIVPGILADASKVEKAAAPAAPTVAATNLPKHVLVVDDSPVNRSVLKAFLKKAGIQAVDFACDGAEALHRLNTAINEGNAHDLVFSDFWMPNMNGLELVEELRADSRFADLPVFAVTADTEFHNDERNKLFTGILLKPLTYGKLVDVFAGLHRM